MPETRIADACLARALHQVRHADIVGYAAAEARRLGAPVADTRLLHASYFASGRMAAEERRVFGPQDAAEDLIGAMEEGMPSELLASYTAGRMSDPDVSVAELSYLLSSQSFDLFVDVAGLLPPPARHLRQLHRVEQVPTWPYGLTAAAFALDDPRFDMGVSAAGISTLAGDLTGVAAHVVHLVAPLRGEGPGSLADAVGARSAPHAAAPTLVYGDHVPTADYVADVFGMAQVRDHDYYARFCANSLAHEASLRALYPRTDPDGAPLDDTTARHTLVLVDGPEELGFVAPLRQAVGELLASGVLRADAVHVADLGRGSVDAVRRAWHLPDDAAVTYQSGMDTLADLAVPDAAPAAGRPARPAVAGSRALPPSGSSPTWPGARGHRRRRRGPS